MLRCLSCFFSRSWFLVTTVRYEFRLGDVFAILILTESIYMLPQSFPYSGMCMDQYRVVMQYNAIAFVATLAGIGLCDLYLRRRLGISLVSAGMTLFTHGQTIVCMTITASLAYALVWSFIADHTYVLLFFIERISALSTGGLC